MRDVAIYFIRDDANDMAYLCQGVLLDDLRRAGYTISKSWNGSSRQTITSPGGYQVVLRREILSCSEEEYGRMMQSKDTCIYKDTEGAPSWGIYKVPNVEYTWGIDRRRKDTGVVHELRNSQYVAEVRRLNTTVYEPAVFPMSVVMHRDNRGRLFCRMRAHPDTEGISDVGKLYFPDRSWENPMEGEALVTIVEEGDSYGFIKGHMVGYKLPDMHVVLPWLLQHLKQTTQVFIIKGSRHGSYVGYYDVVASEYYRISVTGEEVTSEVYFPILEDIDAGLYESKTVQQLQQEYADNFKSCLPEVLTQFQAPEFSPVDGVENRQLDVVWSDHGRCRTDNELLSRAIREGLLKVWQPQGYHFNYLYLVTALEDKVLRAWNDSLAEIMGLINEHNTASSKRIVELIQQGKLKLKVQ